MFNSLIRRALLATMRPVQFVIYAVSGLVPRRMDQWAFGCWSGHRFGDNAGAVFLHTQKHNDLGVRTAWITNETSIRDRLRADGHRAYLTWSPGGVWFAARAGIFVYDSLPKDINYWVSRGAKFVHLRHGIGMKKIERAIDAPDHRLYKLFHGTPLQRLVWRFLLPWHLPVPDLLMSCSPAHASQGRAFYGVTPEQIRITGFARHDRLVPIPTQDRTAIPMIGEPAPADRPVFMYLPTFREGYGQQSFHWDVLEDAARAADVTIAVKLHFVDAERGVLGMDRAAASDMLRIVDPTIDPSDAYPHADGMMSDFSSAPFDFMLLDRPILYYVPDLEEFQASRPLMFELEEIALGPICRDAASLTAALKAAREDGVGAHRSRYDELREHFHTYAPGGASQRVVDAVAERFLGVALDPQREVRRFTPTDGDDEFVVPPLRPTEER